MWALLLATLCLCLLEPAFQWSSSMSTLSDRLLFQYRTDPLAKVVVRKIIRQYMLLELSVSKLVTVWRSVAHCRELLRSIRTLASVITRKLSSLGVTMAQHWHQRQPTVPLTQIEARLAYQRGLDLRNCDPTFALSDRWRNSKNSRVSPLWTLNWSDLTERWSRLSSRELEPRLTWVVCIVRVTGASILRRKI